MTMKTHQHFKVFWLISLIAIAFGLLSIKEGGAILIGNEAALEAAGNYVPFVVWFNFFAGFAYIFAGVGLYLFKRWSIGLTIATLVTTLIVFAGFGIHILNGGNYELRTIIAMSIRTFLWSFFSIIAWRKRVYFLPNK